MSTPLFSEILPGGAMWSMRIPRGHLIRLTSQEAGANVSALFYNALSPLDRLNVPDTLKALHTAHLTKGHVLMSDMGHSLASIVEDSLGWHDPLAGHSTPETIAAAFGQHDYQDFRNDWYRNARDNFLVELSKHGLGLSDIVANVNFFSKVSVDELGRLQYHDDHCPTGATITLRTDMDVLVVFANAPHPLKFSGEYPRVPVLLEIFSSDPAPADDYCRNFRPECGRALALSERLAI